MTEVNLMLVRWSEQKVYKSIAILVLGQLGCVYVWSLAESMGSVEVEREWGHNDADFVDFDLGGDI